jgi:hypothetical protein
MLNIMMIVLVYAKYSDDRFGVCAIFRWSCLVYAQYSDDRFVCVRNIQMLVWGMLNIQMLVLVYAQYSDDSIAVCSIFR